ncbi:Segment Polarity Protein Dishevelled-like Dvl1P1-Like [Manis pentadactyla]|nr:Segment Polarity Protein Dishevelled-like Dvl1P1-Like [Manis pentadactyla]
MAADHPEAGRKRAPLARESNSHSLVVYAELPAVRHFARPRQWRRRRRLEPLIGFRGPVLEPISAGSEPGEQGTECITQSPGSPE